VKRPSGSALVPNFVEPMKAKLAGSIPTGAWTFEIKFDGYRALALRGGNTTRLLSRNEKDLGKKFPKIVNAIAALDVHDAIIDGEIVALDENGRHFSASTGLRYGPREAADRLLRIRPAPTEW
jgi:bifunctional non-homologous end joining protein LigD